VREGGEVLDTVAVDRGCFACMLGAEDGRTLFIAAAEWRGMDALAEHGPGLTGQLLAAPDIGAHIVAASHEYPSSDRSRQRAAAGGERESGAAALSGDRRECWNGSVSSDVRGQAMPARVEAVWAVSGALTVALFASGLLFGDLLATTNFPALNATPPQLREYFLRNVSEVRALSFFHLLAAAALAAFASYLYATLRAAGARVAALALAGGVIGAAFLALSALCYRALAERSVASDPALAHALVVLSYLAGGPAIGVPLALAAGAFAAAIRGDRTFPGWL
jgi:hypothetical protein